MKSHLSVLFSIMLAIITACTPQPQCKVKSEIAKHFRMDVFDSLHIGTEYIETLKDSNNAVIVYLGNSECSECIADFNDFNNHYLDAGIKLPCVYIMCGLDTLTIDFYIKQEKIKTNNNAVMVYDTTYCFNSIMPQYFPNQIFILKKDSLVKRISKLDPNNKDDWDFLFNTMGR